MGMEPRQLHFSHQGNCLVPTDSHQQFAHDSSPLPLPLRSRRPHGVTLRQHHVIAIQDSFESTRFRKFQPETPRTRHCQERTHGVSDTTSRVQRIVSACHSQAQWPRMPWKIFVALVLLRNACPYTAQKTPGPGVEHRCRGFVWSTVLVRLVRRRPSTQGRDSATKS